MTTDPSREAFEKWAKEEGYDTARTYDTDRSCWVWLNPMTADLWKAWQAAMAHKEVELPPDVITVNLVRHAGLDKHKARECEQIVLQLLAAPLQQGE
ncbi:MAG: hypothetical protein RSD57_12430 [Comamonas sp.]